MKEESGYILGIETSSRAPGIALASGAGLVSEFRLAGGRGLDRSLVPGIGEMLSSAGITPRELSGVAASTGPGHFTGLRAGLAAARGLSFALGIPAAGVLSLDNIAMNVHPAEGWLICAAAGAGRDMVFFRLYRPDAGGGPPEALGPPGLCAPENLASFIEKKAVILCDSEPARRRIKEALGDAALLMPPEFGLPAAAGVAQLGRVRILKGETGPGELDPVYLRKPDAEENFPGEDIEILGFSPDELDEVLKIERESFPAPWTEGMFLAEILKSSGLFLTARIRGKIIGYACGWFASDEFHLANFAVAPESRGRGAGRKLLKKIIDEVKSRKKNFLILEVRHKNIPAIGLYEKFGFRPVARRKNYYSDTKEDALLMELRLG